MPNHPTTCSELQTGRRCRRAGLTVSPGVCLRCDNGQNFDAVFPPQDDSKKATQRMTCQHLCADTLTTAPCAEGCGKGYALKVFRCAIHGHCTIAKRGEGIPGRCRGCGDFSAIV